jgi:uncharacterized phage protein gp47/JayE
MTIAILALDEIRTAILRDLRAQLPEAAIGPDSDNYIRASAFAAALEGQYAYLAWAVRQIFPDTSDSDILDRHAALRGLSRKAAVAATGSVTVSGNAGVTLAAGLVLSDSTTGLTFTTDASATLNADGVATVAITATSKGASGNAATALEFSSPPSGVNAEASVVSLTGGDDAEEDAELLTRLLSVIQKPPAGGNANDYKNWALECEGVEHAYVYPLRRGIGTVDIVITTANGVPSASLIATVQAYIDSLRPVGARSVLVLAPTLKTVPISVLIKLEAGADLATVTANLQTVLADYFAGLAPADTAYLSKLTMRCAAVDGVADCTITSPAGNVTASSSSSAVEWLQLGPVTVTESA